MAYSGRTGYVMANVDDLTSLAFPREALTVTVIEVGREPGSFGAYTMMHSWEFPAGREENVTEPVGVVLSHLETAPIPGSTVTEPPLCDAFTVM